MKSITIDYDSTNLLPLDLEALKSDLRIDGDSLDDVISTQYIPSAMQWAEAAIKRSLIARAHRWTISDFPRAYPYTLELPRGLVTAIASIAYTTGGSVVTLTGPSSGSPGGTDYQEDLTGHIARVMPLQGTTWPSVDSDVLAPVKITYTAGWLSDKLVPADIRRALTAHIYGEMELDGLLQIRQGYDIDHADKLISAWRSTGV